MNMRLVISPHCCKLSRHGEKKKTVLYLFLAIFHSVFFEIFVLILPSIPFRCVAQKTGCTKYFWDVSGMNVEVKGLVEENDQVED
jgi:hypothetical protein